MGWRILGPWEAAKARGAERSPPRHGAALMRLRRWWWRKGPARGCGGGANASEARERRVPALHWSAGAGPQDGAAARAPRAWIPEPSLGGTGEYRARARAHPSRLSLLPASPSRPGSVPEAVRDEVPSCFPAGTALPPAPWLLLAPRPKRLCLVGLWIRRGPFPRFILFSALHFIS